MSERAHIGLDNPAFSGRLRRPFVPPASRVAKTDPEQSFLTDYVARRPAANQLPEIPEPADIQPASSSSIAAFVTANAATAPLVFHEKQTALASSEATPLPAVDLEPIEDPDAPAASWLEAWQDQLIRWVTNLQAKLEPVSRHYSPLQLSLFGMACLVFVIGALTSLQTAESNHNAAAQVSALFRQVNRQTAGSVLQSSVPSTAKPAASAFSQYTVAPDLARYIRIPKLGVDARVTQVGVTNSGALGTPDNINDTAWYNASAKPGQPGATLIEGHVSSGTTAGVFYNLKALAPGDTIQVERGDGTVLNYQVVRTQAYAANNVDMQAAVTPVTAGRPGLNLITCNGQVAPGADFNQRLIVFAQQV
ncbi:MAG TPA: class F sortase [Candidatus Dormibacteraeota bacterium]|nr:class F sortase [Candidatus Dormibacteraeota bacterium]